MVSSMAIRSGAPSIAPRSITLRSPSFEGPLRPRFYGLLTRRIETQRLDRSPRDPEDINAWHTPQAFLPYQCSLTKVPLSVLVTIQEGQLVDEDRPQRGTGGVE